MDDRIISLLREARRELETERMRRTEPIAVVGIGCRLPGGVSSPRDFWRLLNDRVDATSEVPPDRWDADALYDPDPAAPGSIFVKRGGFLERIDEFEPEFFGISPREALGMDPQQRLLLEVVWEALENAAIPPEQLGGTNTGVWVGMCLDDYARRSVSSGDLTRINPYTALGNSRSVAAGRIAYALNLRGVVVQLDTACSSSLVAMHQACQSLRSGETDMALVAGVNLMSSPEATVALCRLQALSPDGRCKAFDAAADGYARGEGCGVVVLQRLSDARASGARIHAVIRGSAVNHDGRSNGLTAPNGAAQEAVIQSALANAGAEARDVDYVEAHGTGTLLGDPIEVLALSRTYGQGRSLDAPLYIGTVKTNFGHLEGAAGIAGFIKLALCLSRAQIAPSLHFREPNPKIAWNTLPVRVAAALQPWPERGRPRMGAVSSFGISGTNAHVIVEQAPEGGPRPAVSRSAELIVLSARTREALLASARRLREHLEGEPEVALGDVAYTLLAGRPQLEHRLAFAVATREALSHALMSVELGELPVSAPLPGQVEAARVVFVFPGQGAQWLGMGRQLYAEEPVFRDALLECDRAVREETGWSVVDELHAPAESSRLDRVDVVQPITFAFQWALAALWRSLGIEPQAVVGHSLGEVAAACVAGALSLQDGAAVVCRRSRLLCSISGQGQMALVELSVPEAREALTGFEHLVTVAVSNGPRATVLSGDRAALDRILEALELRGVFCRRVQVDVASHSPQVDGLLERLVAMLSNLRPRPARLPMYSTVTGAKISGQEVSAAYWADNLRQPVRFADSVQALMADGFTSFVEVSPHPLLVTAVDQMRREAGVPGVATGSLRREQPERLTLLSSLAALYAQGAKLAPQALFPEGGRRVELPAYAWQRQRYWLDPPRSLSGPARGGRHALLGARLDVAGGDVVFEDVVSQAEPAWLADHRVGGRALLPAAMMAELFRQAAAQSRPERTLAVSGLAISAPLILPESGSRRVQLLLREQGEKAFLYSQPVLSQGETWTLHASAAIVEQDRSPASVDLASVRQRCTERLEIASVYAGLAARGLDYGPCFRGLRALWRGANEAFAEIEMDAGASGGLALHPALLDSALQSVVGALDPGLDGAFLPFEIGRYSAYAAGFSRGFVHVKLTEASRGELVSADLAITDSAGTLLAEVLALRLRRVDPAQVLAGQPAAVPNALYRVEWHPSPTAAELALTPSGSWLVVAVGDAKGARAIAAALSSHGATSRWTDDLESGFHGSERILCVWDVGPSSEEACAAVQAGLKIARALGTQRPAPKVWWLTRGAVATSAGEDVSPGSAAVWGLGRTLMQEHPELACALVDIEVDASPSVVLRELALADGENQVAWRKGQRHLARLARAPISPALPESESYALEVAEKGSLQTLRLRPAPRPRPGPMDVEIEVRASGLNFRDVLTALGMVNAGELGGECAGVISAVGEKVSQLAVGDRVMAIAEGAFGRFVRTDARLAAKIPESLSFEQAATVPVAFLTAWYALHDLAKLEPGERVLVHAAAGGVGMAAIQLAHAAGAEVLATASAPKWNRVRALGVEHVQSSRDLEFAKAFRTARGGVDVVLNSLTGEFIEASLSLLSPGGRFIEMGKVDIRDEAAVVASYPGVSYRAFDLIDAGLDRIAEMLAAVRRGLETGQLRPLPLRRFEITDAEGAFRCMAQARHVGKIVLVPPTEVNLEGTVLITGGLGALGLEVARDLARRGAKTLLLTGRRGLETPGAQQAVREIEALGAEVAVAAVDAANRQELERLLRDLPADRPLVGVVHAAGVLSDGLLVEQTSERFGRVLAPKVEGAWNLHQLTLDQPLSFFVLFSSLAATIGSASQGSYAAANAFLDGLAAHRRARGLSGTSLGWGPWAKAGLAAGLDSKLRARLLRQGVGDLEPSQGVALMMGALKRPEPHLVIALLDLRVAAKALGGAAPPLWRTLLGALVTEAAEPEAGWAKRLLALPEGDRLEALTNDVRREAARVLSLASIASVPQDRNLRELGLDSLMALELRNNLGRRAGVALSASLIFDHQTPRAIARFLLTRVLELAAPERATTLAGDVRAAEATTRGPAASGEGAAGAAPGGESVARCECQHRLDSPVARIFCFHDAAGTPATFASFSRLSDSNIEVHTIAVARPTPTSPTAPRDYLDAVVRYILDGSNLPFVLLGHSLGALFALRIAEYLAASNLPEPLMLVPSAPPPPGDITLDEQAISAMFGHFLGSSARAPEILRENFMADFFICRGLPRGRLPLPATPIAVFLGTHDPFVPAESVELWRPLTAREFSVTTVPGNHFYIHRSDSRDLLLDELARAILAEAMAAHHAAAGDHPTHSRVTSVR